MAVFRQVSPSSVTSTFDNVKNQPDNPSTRLQRLSTACPAHRVTQVGKGLWDNVPVAHAWGQCANQASMATQTSKEIVAQPERLHGSASVVHWG